MGSGAQIFIVMVFVTVVLLMQGLVVPVFGESAKVRKRLKQRIADIEATGDSDAFSSLLREKYLRRLSPLERRLESYAPMEALARQIEQAGHKILAYRLVLMSVAIGVIVLLASWAYFRMPVAAIFTALLAAYLPFMKIKMDRTNRTKKFEEQLPDAIDMIKRALRAGHPFNGAIKLVAEEMDDPVAEEFGTTFADINYGNNGRRAMLGLLQRVPSVTVMALITSILVQRETGGNLAEILERISAVVRGRFKLQRKVKTLSAEGRLSAWILALVPLVLFAVIWLTSPDYLPLLLEDEVGINMIIYGAVSGVVGIYWVRNVIQIEV